ncbi:MAG: FAD-binding oxidoreductase [Ignavibacteriales bacterium]|nr:FAD-binding oxidoreductase [Ignavibacteriales bacterium]
MIIKTSADEIQNFLSDASNYSGFCDAVYFPENEKDIASILKLCNEKKIKVTAAGNGTGLTGSRVPEGGVVISLERMNKILELNKKEKYVIVQPGVILKDLQDFVEQQKLFYPPDPTERNCFIGATAATNSSGARTFKYGATRNYILALRIVSADGQTFEISREKFKASGYEAMMTTESGNIISFELPRYKMPDTKNAAGYYCKENMDLIDLFIGSEGTLGIITELKLKLLDLPEDILSCVVFFNDENNALDFVDEARRLSEIFFNPEDESSSAKINARGLEFFDKYSLDFLRKDYPNIPAHAESAVWFEQELTNDNDSLVDDWMHLIKKFNGSEEDSWIAIDRNEQEKFKDFRHAISWKVNEFITQHGLKKVGTDAAVPHNFFKRFYFECKRKVEDAKLDYVVYGHFGNAHMHLNMLPKNQNEYDIAKKIYAEICEDAVQYNGTISAEHGVGKSKRDYLLKMYGEETIKEMARLKLVFDPNAILGIGNIFDERYLA